MPTQSTRADILNRLDLLTRSFPQTEIGNFTTSRISEACNVSRSLASQYLNLLVRDGLAVKVNSRPVLFFHRGAMELYLRTELKNNEYSSLGELLSVAGLAPRQDFEHAIGATQSLGNCIEQLKGAIRYPPNGLPVLIVGKHGTGKELMARLSFEYGRNTGALPPTAKFVIADCSGFSGDINALENKVFGGESCDGAVQAACGGVVVITRVDHLAQPLREWLVSRILAGDGASASPTKNMHRAVRFILTTARDKDDSRVRSLSRLIPMVVCLPSLAERPLEERTAFIMQFLHEEGRRLASNISISRGALRALAAAEFDENIDGLKSCVSRCCASAYLLGAGDGLVVRALNLPASLLTSLPSAEDDYEIVSDGDVQFADAGTRYIEMLEKILDEWNGCREGPGSQEAFVESALATLRAWEDYQNFQTDAPNDFVYAYEQALTGVVENASMALGVPLTRKTARLLASLLHLQLWGGAYVRSWCRTNMSKVKGILSVLQVRPKLSAYLTYLSTKVYECLGVELDSISKLLLLLDVYPSVELSPDTIDAMGVIMCHGYSTASSMADAANRILHSRVFEAIDMTYDQRILDVIPQLVRIFERNAHCSTFVILMDMGIVDQLDEGIPSSINANIFVLTNVSTGLALEVGSSLASHEDIAHTFDEAISHLAPMCVMVRRRRNQDAVLFCSEARRDAAENLRKLVYESLPHEVGVAFVTADFEMLKCSGNVAPVFDDYHVLAIVGTMDPDIPTIPFVALDEILCEGSSETLDRILQPDLGLEGIALFHKALARNVTLQSVAESISILNPELLYREASFAIECLEQFCGIVIEPRRRMTLYMHLCSLVERLVTNCYTAPPMIPSGFETDQTFFISGFRSSFSRLCKRYSIEIPLEEVAFVWLIISDLLPQT